jgi:lipid-binding SYLF domain-containing protein
LFKDTETLSKGDILNIENGEVDLGATNDTQLVGIALETKAGTDSTTYIEVITDEDAVYAVYDANARAIGANLDIAGTTGAMTVASSTNADLVVVANSTADEWTLVRITRAEHVLT